MLNLPLCTFSYKKNIDKMADLLALERHHPMDDALWLLEYVSKTKGAEHLKVGSRHLNFFQGNHSSNFETIYTLVIHMIMFSI
jgi:hypothetical protein